jgi:LmbE family N-acetylglucosaminyl deacetylase
VYVPQQLEWHPDHRAAWAILEAARDGLELDLTVYAYEIWTPLGEFDHVADISPVIDAKIAAIHCYESQIAEFQYDRAIVGLNQYRGALAGRCDYAEVFQATWPG